MKYGETYKYEIVESAATPGDTKIKKSGLTAEFTLNDIDRDRQLLLKKKEEIEAQIGIESAKMKNIDRTNPEVGKMSTEMRQVVYIYERAFAFCKVGKEKVEEIDNMLEDYKHEMMDIAIQTGVLTKDDRGTKAGGKRKTARA